LRVQLGRSTYVTLGAESRPGNGAAGSAWQA
jgi:hypothetical protein